jgi:hypothetical protein
MVMSVSDLVGTNIGPHAAHVKGQGTVRGVAQRSDPPVAIGTPARPPRAHALFLNGLFFFVVVGLFEQCLKRPPFSPR